MTHCTYILKNDTSCKDKGVYHLHNIHPKDMFTNKNHELITSDRGRYGYQSLCEQHWQLMLKHVPFHKYPVNNTGTYCSHTKNAQHCKQTALKAWFIQHRDRHKPVFAGISHCETHTKELVKALSKMETTVYRLPRINWDDEDGIYYMDADEDFQLPPNITFDENTGEYSRYSPMTGGDVPMEWTAL